MSRWFRHYAGMMRDDKLVRVAIRSGQTIERVVWVYGAILESAAEIDDHGRFEVDAPEIAYFLRADEADVVAIISGLETVGRIRESVVVKWSDRQFSSDRSAERQKRYRDKKREENAGSDHDDVGSSDDGKASQNAKVTSLSRHRDAPELETELDTDSSEAKASSPRKWACPQGVDPIHWRDFLKNRKTRHLTNSETAYAGQLRELAKLADDEWPPGRLVQHAAEKGWGSINDPRETRHASQPSIRGPRPDPTLALVRAATEAQRQDNRDYGEARPALPSSKFG